MALAAGDYASAAQFFEMAYSASPNPIALVAAIDAHQNAGNLLRAGTLALRLEDLDPSDEDRALAERVVAEAAPRFVMVEIDCDGCEVDIDGALLGHSRVFVEADTSHRATAIFGTGQRTETFEAGAGETTRLEFTAPPPTVADSPTTGATPAVRDDASGLPVGYFLSGLVLTLGAAGTLVWSGVDTLNDADRYEDAIARGDLEDAQRRLDEGEKEERRTNALIGVTAGLGAATVLLAIFTDWQGDEEANAGVRASVAPTMRGAAFVLEGSFQ